MTEEQVQGKWVLVRNNGEFEITEFELARSNCNQFLNRICEFNKIINISLSLVTAYNKALSQNFVREILISLLDWVAVFFFSNKTGKRLLSMIRRTKCYKMERKDIYNLLLIFNLIVILNLILEQFSPLRNSQNYLCCCLGVLYPKENHAHEVLIQVRYSRL